MNLRLTSTDSIDVETYMYRSMATGNATFGVGYENYRTAVYNETDGYYHVGTVDGPLLLANMLKASNWSQYSFYEYVADARFYNKENDPSKVLTQYASYASNSVIPGYTPVTEELKQAIIRAMELYAPVVDKELKKEAYTSYANEWLEICYFYAAYGTNGVQLGNPIMGVAPFAAYEGHVGANVCPFEVQVMPRGKYTAFTPETSGVYKIQGTSDYETNVWIYDSNMKKIISDDDLPYRDSLLRDENDENFMVYAYFEEGKTYYISTAYYDFYQLGDLTFNISYVSEAKYALRQCSPGFFTSSEVDEDNLPAGTMISGGVDVMFDSDDGYYHVKEKDDSEGSIVYADFYTTSSIFKGMSLVQVLNNGGFDFTKDEDGYPVDDSSALDLTNEVKTYLEQVNDDPTSELYGLIEVDQRLAELLQLLMDKYTFAGVKNSWAKLCYYYDYLG